ncbi:uncharacterized protein LOC134612223 [Pelobates fuscus]|uniref:uncharacterized protein LOC134612223 n=1 Tax=Pelobates fuscus TaxID=191477 RepID=UPI002FE456EA
MVFPSPVEVQYPNTKMFLRSRKILPELPKEPCTPRTFSDCDSPIAPQTAGKVLKKVQLKSPKDESVMTSTKKLTQGLLQNPRDYMEDEGSTPQMILRSRKMNVQPHKESHTPIRNSDSDNPVTTRFGGRRTKRVQPTSHWNGFMTPSVKKSTNCLLQNCFESMTDEEEKDLETPLKERSVRVNFQMDESFSEEQDILCSIFSPVLCFLSPDVSGSDCSSSSSSSEGSSSYIVEQPYFSSLCEEDPEEEFKLSQYSSNFVNKLLEKQHRWMDIPLKTRNSPKNTLVLDPENILVSSSLLPDDDPDYTFLTPFQDNYYKY